MYFRDTQIILLIMPGWVWAGCLFFVSTTIAGRDTWSRWYNTDSPVDGDDEEILQNIRKSGKPYCKSGLTKVQCRVVGTITLFSDASNVADNFLSTPCNQTGVVCLDRDQRPRIHCRDYEIRFSCDTSDKTYSRFSSNGGFIALIASLSVIVPILGVMSVQFLRACRERRKKEKRSRDIQIADQPPSYDEVCISETLSHTNMAATVRHSPETSLPEVGGASGTSSSSPNICGSACQSARSDDIQEITDRTDRSEMNVFVVGGLDTQTELVHTTAEQPPSYAEALKILKSQSGSV